MDPLIANYEEVIQSPEKPILFKHVKKKTESHKRWAREAFLI